jgi:hypothetical protein
VVIPHLGRSSIVILSRLRREVHGPTTPQASVLR